MKKTKREKLPRELTNKIARISAHGLMLVIITFLGLYAGMYLDKITGMTPSLTFIFLTLGIILGFKGFIQEVISERRK
jgi:F0F1-type ATP synthase assembly protein I